MRVTCPECGKVSSVKANARRIKCEHCAFRQEVPEGGLASTTSAWRKANPKSFVPEGGFQKAASGADGSRTTTLVVVGAIVLLAIGGVWAYMATRDGGETTTGDATGFEADFITPGMWNVSAEHDTIMVWAHNKGGAPADVQFSLTGPDGGALPNGWSVLFSPGGASLQPNVPNPTTAPGGQFPDWTYSLATLTIPAQTSPQAVAVELHAGESVTPATVNIRPFTRVAQAGDHILTHYDLRKDDGTPVEDGEYCVDLGPGTNAVLGYGYGMIGSTVNETVPLIVPPPYGYGFAGHALGSSRPLHWTTTVLSFETAC